MPNIVYGDVGKVNQSVLANNDTTFDYDYPEGLDLRPESDLHRYIVTEVLRRAQVSNGVMKNRFDSWNEIDRCLTAYIEPDSGGFGEPNEERDIKKDPGSKSKPVSIVFPYSYAILETVLTYLVMAFLQEPIFRYEGVSPEDTMGAILLEKVVSLHTNKTKVGLALHTMFRDSLAYGIGIGAPGWQTHMGSKMVAASTGFMGSFGRFIGMGQEKKMEEDVVLFEGNKLDNVDPYLWLPDPNVPCDKVQDGEFCGWVNRTSFVKLMNEEAVGPDLFNVRYLKNLINKKSSMYGEDHSRRTEKTGASIREAGGRHEATDPVDTVNMFVDLIPKDWKLGASEYPEKWLFSVASDALVIKAKKLGLTHNMYPISVIAPDSDGYTSTPVSRIEVLHGLQGTLDWLFNSHVANVRKAINDMIIYDPYLLNAKDMESPKAGKLVRMRRPAWGRGVEHAAMQLNVNDITRANIGDSGWIVQWMQKIGAADDSMMGSLRQGGPERLTGGEFQGTQMGAIRRLERLAKLIGLQGMQDLGYMFASHTQQLMSQEQYVKVVGSWEDELRKEFGDKVQKDRIKATPFDLLVDYDVLVRDGSIPGSNFSDVWVRMFDTLASHPELDAKFDIVKIFRHIARNSGAKNISDFERKQPPAQARVAQDEDVMREVEAGNLVPA